MGYTNKQDQMLHLFFVTHDYSGVKTYANELIEYFSKQLNISVHLIFWESVSFNEYTVIYEKDVVKIHLPAVKGKQRDLIKYSSRCIDLMSHIVNDKEQIIFHLNYAFQLYFGLEARNRFGAKLIYTMHFVHQGFSSLADVEYDKLVDIDTLVEAVEKKMIQDVDRIICVTHFAKKMLVEYLKISEKKVFAIHNGNGSDNTNIQLLDTQRREIKKKLGFSETEHILLFVGRLESRKGIQHLIRAFNKLDHPNIRLVLIGDGRFDTGFEFAYNNWGRITFTGKIKPNDVSLFYSIATIGIIPSTYEQCSYVAIEMMKNALPIIVAASPGLIELFEHYENAIVIPLYKQTDNVMKLEIHDDELAEAMDCLLKNDVLRKKLGQNARNTWELNNHSEKMGNKTIDLYKQLINYEDLQTL